MKILFRNLLSKITRPAISQRLGMLVIATCIRQISFAQETQFLKVHFLYGSKPRCEFREEEKKWFGGIHGGHVGIESDTGMILNFNPSGKYHIFEKPEDRHSLYALHSENNFYSIFGGDPDSMKKAVIYIPVDNSQKKHFDKIAQAYLIQTPYDYAFFGMRCAAATYEILSQMEIVPVYSKRKTIRKNFYPKKTRKRLFKLAEANHWRIEKTEGFDKRKWERD